MKKILIILALALLPLIGFGQNQLIIGSGGGVVVFQNKVVIPETPPDTSTQVSIVGDGVVVGDNVNVGDAVYNTYILYPKQYIKEEETLNILIS